MSTNLDTEIRIKSHLIQKHDLEVNWNKATGFVPYKGQLIVYDIEVDKDGNTLKDTEGNLLLPAESRLTPYTYERFKIGDGIKTVSDLPFVKQIQPGTGENAEVFNSINNFASGNYSHAEGGGDCGTKAAGDYSHSEGCDTIANGDYSHAEGRFSTAAGDQSHAEGENTAAYGAYSHAEGFNTEAGDYSDSTAGEAAHAEGYMTKAIGSQSHAEGDNTEATGFSAHAEGGNTTAEGDRSHAEGDATTASEYASHAEGYSSSATGQSSHAEGENTKASGWASHAEGEATEASGSQAHAEGSSTCASEGYAHAEGCMTKASGMASHAENYWTEASSSYSHAEGYFTVASGDASHAEGTSTVASGSDAHAEGWETVAFGNESHAEGNGTIAKSYAQHAQGKFNIEDTEDTYAHIVGNGTSDADRSNAHTLDWEGNAWFAGDVYVGSTSETNTNKDAGSKKLATEDVVNAVKTEIDAIKNGETFIPTLQMGQEKSGLNFIDESGKWEPNPSGNYWSGWSSVNDVLELEDGSTVTVNTWQLKGMWLYGNNYLHILITPQGIFERDLYVDSSYKKQQSKWRKYSTTTDISDVIRSSAQNLTEAQKTQARVNIDAAKTISSANIPYVNGGGFQIDALEAYNQVDSTKQNLPVTIADIKAMLNNFPLNLTAMQNAMYAGSYSGTQGCMGVLPIPREESLMGDFTDLPLFITPQTISIAVRKEAGTLAVGDPISEDDATTKKYVDNNFVNKAGDIITGNLSITGKLQVQGTTETVDAVTYKIENNVIEFNPEKVHNETWLTGLAINKGLDGETDLGTYGIMYDPSTDAVKLGFGQVNEENKFKFNENESAPIATREEFNDSWEDDAIFVFDKTTKKFKYSGKTLSGFKEEIQSEMKDYVANYIETYMSQETIIEPDGSQSISVNGKITISENEDGTQNISIGG
jgi:hypothetical protein